MLDINFLKELEKDEKNGINYLDQLLDQVIREKSFVLGIFEPDLNLLQQVKLTSTTSLSIKHFVSLFKSTRKPKSLKKTNAT